jgi:hypothetical protein
MQNLHNQYQLKKENRDAEVIQTCMNEISEIRQVPRFREDFPSFAKFKKYIKKEKLTLKDLNELVK